MTSLRLSLLILVLLTAGPGHGWQDDRGLSVRELRSGLALDREGRLWAVVIGVSSYRNLGNDAQLRFAHRDAEAFAAFLRSPNGGGFPSTQIKLLTNQNATLAAMRTALGTWLPRSAEPDDIVYIFFAGHGVVEGERDGYLLAHDSDPQNLYATALPVAELDRIITERLNSRVAVLLADACHAGQLGWTSRGAAREVLINRYLDEVGQSGAGVVRILASRADQRSYEDARWGGGHGVFTYFLLQGLEGRADRDGDGFVRAGELVDFLSEKIPAETQALQHPRIAGSIDVRMPLAVVSTDVATDSGAANLALELRGIPDSEVYVNNSYRGKIRTNGLLLIEGLRQGSHEISVDPPGAPSLTQTVSLSSPRTILELNTAIPGRAAVKSSPLVPRIREALAAGNVLDANGAWDHFQRLMRETPTEPQLRDLETDLISALEEIGQQTINDYVHSSVSELTPDLFRRGAEAFSRLRQLRSGDASLEARYLFCLGRSMIVDGRAGEAVEVLRRAVSLDGRAAHSFNALGVAYEKRNEPRKALESFERASQLAPNWAVPRLHVGIQRYLAKDMVRAEREFRTAVHLDPRYPYSRYLLARVYRETNRPDAAKTEAEELLRLSPGYAPGYAELGLIHESRKEWDRAADAYETYLRLAPDSSDAPAIRERARRCRAEADRRAPRLRRP